MVLKRLQLAMEHGRRAAAGAQTRDYFSRAEACWGHIHLDDTHEPGEGLEEHEALCARSRFKPVVISNHFAPRLLAKQDIIFEFLPVDIGCPRDAHGGSDLAMHYLYQRLAHIVDFWQIVGLTWSGNRSPEIRSNAKGFAPKIAMLGDPKSTVALQNKKPLLS